MLGLLSSSASLIRLPISFLQAATLVHSSQAANHVVGRSPDFEEAEALVGAYTPGLCKLAAGLHSPAATPLLTAPLPAHAVTKKLWLQR